MRTPRHYRLVAGLLAAVAAMPALAADYQFSFSSSDFSGSGLFTVDDVPTGNGGYQITATSGTVSVMGMDVGFTGPTTAYDADNLLFLDGGPYFSFNGTSVELADGTNANLYYSAGAYQIFADGGIGATLDSVSVSRVSSTVPEPATWMAFITGFGMIGAAVRNRRRIAVSFA